MSSHAHSRRNSAAFTSSPSDTAPSAEELLAEFSADASKSSVRSTRLRPYLAEDARQEALLAVYKALNSFDPTREVPIANYMRTVIARACWKADKEEARSWASHNRNVDVYAADFYRKHVKLDLFVADELDSTMSEVVRVDQVEAIESVVRDLKPGQRELFELLYVEGLTQRDAAARLGVTQQRVQQVNRSVIEAIRRVVCN